MKHIRITVCLVCVVLGAAFLAACSCGGGGNEKSAAVKSPEQAAYVCPMGCAQSDKPGKCPKCGMNLVEKK